MTKIIFLLWLLSGKVQVQKDHYGYVDYCEGRKLFTLQVTPTIKKNNLYKGEILNYIRTGVWTHNEDFSDKNGRLTYHKLAIDTLYYMYKGVTRAFPLYAEGKKRYVIDPELKVKVYLKK